ncbi:hydroxyacid dehydrogenase [Corallococcus sp. CA054B]|uniref:virulence RhuM family protein n=1 Tax=Corallococcus sp. CA054B TaxID=2316734 RepID=UPI000EA025B7|nr:virulence RhuM family protein [Corallococcus sp. CA054B]RKG66615.1 hydroxyacid dehydrogenase [Corallococcus sp. CA054B]
MTDDASGSSELILYQTEDGRARIQCRFEGETLWLTQAQMAELFQTTPQNITLHLKDIFAEGELDETATCKPYLQVRQEGSRQVTRTLRHYNLDAVLAVGFRVRSHRGTQFRQWAKERLGEYLVKGFTLDDERLKNPPGPGQRDYFDELLERIREIRASERRFYQKVLDIYATSVDYDPKVETSQRFFATVQNKMHWAAHGHTAAEIVHARADATQPFMGMRSIRSGGIVRREEASVAKNYLTESELAVLLRIVSLYIEFAELQALERKQMTMRDWITKLDEFLKASGRQLLTHAGSVSAEAAKAKAEQEYARYHSILDAQPRPIDAEFEKVAKQLKKPAAPRRTREKKS